MAEALHRAGANPSRESLEQAFATLGQQNFAGFPIRMGTNDRQASDLVELTFLSSQRWEP